MGGIDVKNRSSSNRDHINVYKLTDLRKYFLSLSKTDLYIIRGMIDMAIYQKLASRKGAGDG
jgi:hypothetical protein